MVARPAGAGLVAEVRFESPHTVAQPMVFAALGLAERMHAGQASAGLGCERVAVEVERADSGLPARGGATVLPARAGLARGVRSRPAGPGRRRG